MNTVLERGKYGLCLVLLVAFSAVTKLTIPLKGDTPYYYDQVDWLHKHGRLLENDLPLAFWLLWAFSPSMENFYAIYRVLFAVIMSLAAVPIYFLCKNIYTSKPLALLSSFIVMFHPNTILYPMYGGFKNGLGNLFLLITLCLFYKLLSTKKKLHGSLFGIFLILTILTHTLSTAMLALFFLVFLALHFIKRGRRGIKRDLDKFFGYARHIWNEKYIAAILVLIMVLALAHSGIMNTLGLWRYRKKLLTLTTIHISTPSYTLPFSLTIFVLFFSCCMLIREHGDNDFLTSTSLFGVLLFILSLLTIETANYRFTTSLYLPFSILTSYCIKKSYALAFAPFYVVLTYFGSLSW